MISVGDKIRITRMLGKPQYDGKEGIVTRITADSLGNLKLNGTWGEYAIYSYTDSYEIVESTQNKNN